MSVTVLQVESSPSGGDSLFAWLDDVEALLDRAEGLDVAAVGDNGLVDGVRRLTRAGSRIAAVKLAAVAEVDRRGAARRTTGAISTAGWLRADGMGAGAAARQVGLAAALVEHDRTRRALASGVIDPERAQVITAALDGLSERVGEQDRGQLEARLLAQAGRLDLGRLRRLALVEAARVDPAGSGDLAGPERAARAGRELTVWRGTDGMHHLRGRLDTAAAATLAAALDPLAAPAPTGAGGPDPLAGAAARRRAGRAGPPGPGRWPAAGLRRCASAGGGHHERGPAPGPHPRAHPGPGSRPR